MAGMAQPAGNWINAERQGGGRVLVNLDQVRIIEEIDGLAVLHFTGGGSASLTEGFDEFFMRAQGRK